MDNNKIESLLNSKIYKNIERKLLIKHAIEKKEAIVLNTGTLATWTPVESTGRSPKDTVTVKTKKNENFIDWNSPYNIPISEETFSMIKEDAIKLLNNYDELYITERQIGSDSNYALKVNTITPSSLTALFTDNMFRPLDNINDSIFKDKPFTLIVLPKDKLNSDRYEGRLRKIKETGKTSDMVIAINYDDRMGIVIGSQYMGSVKKLMFTVMNYYLVFENILPLHCSANEGEDGDIALFLGLSGTGKTTLSATADRKLLGDDEHGWSGNGVANFENGCYAKLINLNKDKEPEIYNACFHQADPLNHGAIVENVMVYPDGTFDLFDNRFTDNSRGSYPLTFLKNIKKSSTGGHPRTIIFLTADANGVLPPISKLDKNQAMLWFLMGYTSKLAGTETGIVEPVSTFSRFFGAPFMPANPDFYSNLLGNYLEKYNTKVFLINTGWIGGPFGIGKRIDLNLTRAMVKAALDGKLENVKYKYDTIFHLNVPVSCPGIENNEILFPEKMWNDKNEYLKRAKRLASDFSKYYDTNFKNKVKNKEIEKNCPGK